MPKWVEKILKYNLGEKSLIRAPFAIYLDLACLLKKKEQFCENNNLEESYTEKKARHEPSGWATFAWKRKKTWLLWKKLLYWKFM